MSEQKLYIMQPDEDLDEVLDREFGEKAYLPNQRAAYNGARTLGLLKRPDDAFPLCVCEEIDS